jgi:guanine deaminase
MNNRELWMREAIQLALDNMRAGGGGPFGAVIVRGGEVIARGSNRVTTANDPTAHAEVVAIREACRVLQTFHLEGCEIYSSCEPCPMCLAAVYWARLDGLFFAGARGDAADAGFDDEFLYRELAVALPERRIATGQLLRNEALSVFNEWKAKPDKIMY